MVSPTKIAKSDAEPAPEYQEALEKIDEIQNEIEKLNEQASEEILKIDQKYDKLRQPFYKKRCEHIAKIPNFWAKTLINHPQISSIISEEDEEILKHLTEIEVVDMEDAKSGFRIIFHFEPNPYFENSQLTREIFLSESAIKPGACEIKWKEGQDPAKKADKGGRKRGLTDSFFYWFTQTGEGDEGEGMVIDEIGELVKEEIYANPLQYLIENEADDDEADEDEGDMGSSDDDEIDEEDSGEGEGEDGDE